MNLKDKIRQAFGRLNGVDEYLNKEYPHNVRAEVAENYNEILHSLKTIDDLDDFMIPKKHFIETVKVIAI